MSDYVTGYLTEKTDFCIDVYHNEHHTHFDDVGPRAIVTCGELFRLGDKIKLYPIKADWGDRIPNCTKLASTFGDTQFKEMMGEIKVMVNIEPEATKGIYMDLFRWVEKFEGEKHGDSGKVTTTFIQWKGTFSHFTFNCLCGAHLLVADDFAYNVMCPACSDIYYCSSRLPLELVTEVPEGEKIHVEEPSYG